MARGRPPQPKALNDLKGDPGRRRRYTKEPEPLDGMPVCPDYLDDIAKTEWDEITQILKDMRLLSKADRAAIEMYCESYSEWRQASDHVRKYGSVILSPNKNYPMISPYATMKKQSFEQCRKMLLEFGLTPAARARMRVSIDERTDDKWSGLLKVG